MSKTQKQIDEFFKSKKEQEQTLQPRSQMILNDEPLPSSKKKYQKTELDRALEQFKGIDEWSDEKQKDWELRRKVETLTSQLERMAMEKSQLYTDNVLLKRELEEYRKLKSECHKDIEKVWMYDSSYGLDDNQTIDRDACIERVFYKIANEWID